MTTQQRIVLERALFHNEVMRRDLVPAMEVKRFRKFPCQYSKRCSELVFDGLLQREGRVDGMMSFSITEKGRKALRA